MKKWISNLTLTLLLAALFTLSAFAFQDHGNTYTAIDALDSDRFAAQGETSLPALSNQYSLGLHVDIVDDLEDYSIYDYAALFYEQYSYGFGANQDGAALMIYALDRGGSVDLMDYCVYAQGLGADVLDSDDAANLYAALDLILQGTGLSYEDARDSCADAVDAFYANMALLMAAQISSAPSPETAVPEGPTDEPATQSNAEAAPTPARTIAPTEVTPASDSGAAAYPLILDEAGLLTDAQKLRLEDQAQKIASKYDCNPYVLTVTSLDGASLREFAKTYYQEHKLGSGDYRNGILFLIAMDSRDYVTITYGRNPKDSTDYGVAILAFTDYGISKLEDDVVPKLSEGDYFTAFHTYLTDCETYLSYYSQGEAFDKGSRLPGAPLFSPVQILIIIFVPLLIALIVCLIFKAQMKTAKKAAGAGSYLVDGSFQLTNARDDYIRTNRSRRKIERDNSGGSGGSSTDSDGFGGSSGGKF